MKRFAAICLSCILLIGFPSSAEDLKTIRFSVDHVNEFQIIENKSETSVENGLMCAVSSDMVSFYLRPAKPVKINNLDMTIRYKLKVEAEETPSYVAIRHYGVDSKMNTAMTMLRTPKNNEWYEGEYPLYKSSVSTGSVMFSQGSELKQLRIDVKNTSGKSVKLSVEYMEIVPKAESALGETIGTEAIKEMETKISAAKPGDTIVIPDGTYSNVTFPVRGTGTKEKPITIKAQTPGKVLFTGLSSMVIDGSYLTVDGLLFQDGWSARVITFSKTSVGCRLTNSAVINFNDKEKATDTRWVNINGQENRVDHCFFRDKRTMGVLLEVLRTEERPDKHMIDHNYFGYYEQGIGNGAETVRIGTGTYAQADSQTVISNNFFEKCDGEAEIISNKSQNNEIKNNTFYNSAGCLTLRMGKGNLIEGNLFAEGAAGLRVIDADQVVKNNYFYRMRGRAIAVESGTDPNPAAYFPVKNALIENNTFDECALAAEMNYGLTLPGTTVAYPRKYAPQGIFQSNLILGGFGINELSTDCEITYAKNIQNGGMPEKRDGFTYGTAGMARSTNGMLSSLEGAGANLENLKETPLSPLQIMPAWIGEKIKAKDKRFLASDVIIGKASPFGDSDVVALAVGKRSAYTKLAGYGPVDLNQNVLPVVVEDRTLVPLRFVSEAFGFSVSWDDGTQSAILEKDSQRIVCQIGSNTMETTGGSVILDAPPMLLEDRTFLPLRAVAEAVGRKVNWDERGIIVIADDSVVADQAYFDAVIDYMGY